MSRTKGSKNRPKIGITASSTASGTSTTGSSGAASNGLFSIGSMASTPGGIQKQADFSVTQTPSFFYSPELTSESWLLPKSRQEILKWVRIFFNLEPYIQSITMMHAQYPFSKFEIITPDKSVTQFYEDMAFGDKFDLYSFLLDASLSYQKFGEAICFGNMDKGDDGLYRWSKFVLLEPELLEIKTDMFTGEKSYEMIPTEELKQLVGSTKAEDQERKESLLKEAPEIVAAINEKRNIKLSNEVTSQIARITDPSATRGSSPIQACFKVLIYQDWIRLAQSAFAQRYIFPIELWTIGDLEKNIIPTSDDLDKFRNTISQAVQQPPFTLVFPPTVKYEPLSTLGKQFPINNEYEYIQDQLMVALGVNKNIIMGEGPSFSNMQGMALHKLMMTYKTIRDKFENWMLYHYFKPIAEKNGFYSTINGKKKLILPEISWNKSLDIQEQEAEREMFIALHEKGFLSTETLYTKFPSLNFSSEQKKLELERGTIWDKGEGARLPGKVHKSITPQSGGGGGGMGGGVSGEETPEPIEPIEPTEGGELPTGEEAAPETAAPETAAPETGAPTAPAAPIV